MCYEVNKFIYSGSFPTSNVEQEPYEGVRIKEEDMPMSESESVDQSDFNETAPLNNGYLQMDIEPIVVQGELGEAIVKREMIKTPPRNSYLGVSEKSLQEWKCPVCYKIFPASASVNQHLGLHVSDEVSFTRRRIPISIISQLFSLLLFRAPQCPNCDIYFESPMSVYQHIMSVHKNTSNVDTTIANFEQAVDSAPELPECFQVAQR